MFKKNLMIVGLAGLMVLGGNMGVYADASVNKAELMTIVPSVITGLAAENSELVRIIPLQPAVRSEQLESVYVEFVEPIALQPAMNVEMTDDEQAEFEKMKQMSSQELVEYVQLHNPKVIPALEMTPAHYVLTAE